MSPSKRAGGTVDEPVADARRSAAAAEAADGERSARSSNGAARTAALGAR